MQARRRAIALLAPAVLLASGLIYHLFYQMLVRFKWGSKRYPGELTGQNR